MTSIPNDIVTSEIEAIALKAMRDAEKGAKLTNSSRITLTYVLTQTLDASVEALVRNQKGETSFAHSFVIRDYLDPDYVRKTCGDNSQAKGAMTRAVIKRLTGIDEPTAAQKTALNEAAKTAFNLLAICPADKVTLSKGGNMQVPGYVINPAPKEDAPESAVEAYEAAKDTPQTLDGTKGRSFRELSARVRPKVEREGQSGQGKPDAGFSRIDYAKALLGPAADEWAEYMAAMSSRDLVAALSMFAEAERENASEDAGVEA